mmetsp:Transcript_157935/g.274166  ORF Transcript_157935/g.274166 Transcript_157935/m.274166 type:complete len:206 (+) Transcript_157935:197-814(+)
MSSMAFFTRVKASMRTRSAKAARRGLCTLCETALSSFTACVRRNDDVELAAWAKEGLKVFVNKSCASSELRIDSALDTASISSCLVFCRSSHSLSVKVHFSLSIIRNCSSADRELLVSSMSSFDCAFFKSAVASELVFASICDMPAAISASFAALRSSYAFWFAISSFCDADKLDSNVSFICVKMPKISPDCGAYDCLKVGEASK